MQTDFDILHRILCHVYDSCQTTLLSIICLNGMDDRRDENFKQINEIRDAILECESRLDKLLGEFGWSSDKLPKKRKELKDKQPVDEVSGSGSAECKQENVDQLQQEKIDLNALVNLCATIDTKSTNSTNYADINKLKRDLKRRRMKYRTTKTAPLTYTEELRELISLQMELVKESD